MRQSVREHAACARARPVPGFGNVTEHQIRRGVRALADTLREPDVPKPPLDP